MQPFRGRGNARRQREPTATMSPRSPRSPKKLVRPGLQGAVVDRWARELLLLVGRPGETERLQCLGQAAAPELPLAHAIHGPARDYFLGGVQQRPLAANH